jgi:hypothetical protein
VIGAAVDIGWDELGVTTAALVSVVETEATPVHVKIVWHVILGPGSFATIYRQADGGEWAPVRHALPDGRSQVVFEDRDVSVGSRYGYRIGVRNAGSEAYFGSVWATVPAAVRFALTGFSPNPATRDGMIAFTAGGPELTTLRVFDLSGRSVFMRSFEGHHAGERRLRLQDIGGLSPGIYVIQLNQGAQTLRTKGILLK